MQRCRDFLHPPFTVRLRRRIDTDFTAQADTSEGPYAVLVGANQMYVAGNFAKISSSPVSAGGVRVKQPGLAIYPAIS